MNKNLIRFKTATGKTVVVELFESVEYPPELYIYYEESDQNIAMIRQIESDMDVVETEHPGMEVLLWEDPTDDFSTKSIIIPECNEQEEE